MSEIRLRQVTSIDELKEFLEDGEGLECLSWDTETKSLDPSPENVVGHSFAHNGKEAIYVPVAHQLDPEENLDPDEVWDVILPYLQEPKVLVVYNYKFEGQILRRKGVIRQSNHKYLRDAMIYLWIKDSNRKRLNLKDAAEDMLQIDMLHLKDVPGCEMGKGKTRTIDFSRTRPCEATLYAAADPVCTMRLYDLFHTKVMEEQPFIIKLEHSLLDPLMKMERSPTYIDRAFLKQGVKDLTRWRNQMAARIYEVAGYDFNIGSTQAVGEFLKKRGVKLPKTATGKDATGADVIEKLAEQYPECALILGWRSLDKERGTYAEKFLECTSEEKPYCCFKFKSVGAPTGRFASGGVEEGEDQYADMNVQAIPGADAYPEARARIIHNPPLAEMDQQLRQIGEIQFEDDSGASGEEEVVDFFFEPEEIEA